MTHSSFVVAAGLLATWRAVFDIVYNNLHTPHVDVWYSTVAFAVRVAHVDIAAVDGYQDARYVGDRCGGMGTMALFLL